MLGLSMRWTWRNRRPRSSTSSIVCAADDRRRTPGCDVAEIGELGLDGTGPCTSASSARWRSLGDACGVGVDGDGLRTRAGRIAIEFVHRAVRCRARRARVSVADIAAETHFVVVGHTASERTMFTTTTSVPDRGRSRRGSRRAGLTSSGSLREPWRSAVGALRRVRWRAWSDRPSAGAPHLINEYEAGRLPQDQVCDAHPELIRAARNVGTQTRCVVRSVRKPTSGWSPTCSVPGCRRRVAACRRPRRCANSTTAATNSGLCRRGMRRVPLEPSAAGHSGRRPAVAPAPAGLARQPFGADSSPSCARATVLLGAGCSGDATTVDD